MLPRKTTLAIVSIAAVLDVLSMAKVLRPVDLRTVAEFAPRPSAPAEPLLKHPFRENSAPVAGQKPVGAFALLEDRTHQLYPFYHSLGIAESRQGVARVLHYGDSPTTADSITADVRSLLQERFGDAGHGFVLIAKPWPWYGHRGVELHGTGWKIEAASQNRARDGIHGLGGVSFLGSAGASSHIHLTEAHARVEVEYLRRPDGGTFTVTAGEQALGDVGTAGDQEAGYADLALPDGTTDVTITVKAGSVRLFGASFEKDEPGLIYNSLGVNGGNVQMALRYFDREHWAGQMQHQKPDLVVINYGTNESSYASYIDTLYEKELRELIARVKTALPGTAMLIMSPMDRGERRSDGTIGTLAALPRLIAIQKRVAEQTGCAFFNTFEAMGGEGTMGRWYETTPRLVSADFMHPLPQGARKVGLLLDEALVQGYNRYKMQQKLDQVTEKH
jgi:lysophospholipase L1-like esterase